jgi:hypothetical protein
MAGVLLATASGIAFVVLLIAVLTGLFDNPYAGLVVGIAIPALLVLGLLLIPIGMRLQRRKLARHPEASDDWPVVDFRDAGVRRTALLIAALTTVNVAILLHADAPAVHGVGRRTPCRHGVCHVPHR